MDSVNIYLQIVDYPKALNVIQQILKVYQDNDLLPPIYKVRALNKECEIYWRSGQLKTALTVGRQAYDLGIKFLGEAHPVVGNVWMNLGIVYDESEESERALAVEIAH